MNDQDEPLTSEEFREAMLEFSVIMSLRKQLENAHEYIEKLRKDLKDQTATKIAEQSFGYEDGKPRAPRWTHADHLPITDLVRLRKTNTEVVESTTYVTNELRHMYHDAKQLEGQIKSKMMSDLFCDMQERGLFRFFQRKVEHETIYTIAIEVAKK